jgi:hypothetical protein
VVIGDSSTYNSAGEVVSYLATNGVHAIGAPGEDVKEACGGAPGRRGCPRTPATTLKPAGRATKSLGPRLRERGVGLTGS